MKQQTYEIIAKYIADKTGLAIQWHDEGICPQADVKHNVIHLPLNVHDEKVYSALSLLMHEAAHLKYTTEIPDWVVKNKREHMILNAIEDVRIDWKNFRMLPNIRDFYEVLYDETKKKWSSKLPLIHRCMLQCILWCEGFDKKFKDPESEKKIREYNSNRQCIITEFSYAKNNIDNQDWKALQENIRIILSFFPQPQQQQQKQQGQPGQGNEQSKDKSNAGDQPNAKPNAEDGNQKATGSQKTTGKDDKNKGSGQAEGDDKAIENLLKPGKDYFKGQGDGSGEGRAKSGTTSPLAIREQTKNKFKELLNIKVNKIVDEGTKLNTENLTAFFTGQLDELFCQEKIVKKKHSKILMLLDCSGSMVATMMDRRTRKETLVECIKHLTATLDEVIKVEGVNVSYDLVAFDRYYHPLPKDNWIQEYYRHDGGTALLYNFRKAHEQLLSDPNVDGKKLMVLITDGCVRPNEIKEMEKIIVRHNTDVRCMVLGIGASPTQPIVSKRNILIGDTADTILMDAINDML